MKKTVLLALLVCGLFVSFFVGTSMSQEPVPAPKPKVIDELELINLERLELQRLNVPELQNLERLENDPIAEKKLMQVVRLLEEITNHYPDSNVADRANEILEVWKQLAVQEAKDTKQDRKPPRVVRPVFVQLQRRHNEDRLRHLRKLNQKRFKTMAEEKFQQALQLLQEIVKGYPKSNARFRALRMLKVSNRLVALEAEDGIIIGRPFRLEPLLNDFRIRFGPVRFDPVRFDPVLIDNTQ